VLHTRQNIAQDINTILNSPLFFGCSAPSAAWKTEQSPNYHSLKATVFPEALWRKVCELKISNEEISALCMQANSLNSGRLGKLFEFYANILFAKHFKHGNFFENVPVRSPLAKGVHSWGEFDLLLECQKKLYHIEHSIKFYLQIYSSENWRWCFGPGVKDRLDLKGIKTFTKQLYLAENSHSWEVLAHYFPHIFPKAALCLQEFLEMANDKFFAMAFSLGTVFYPLHEADSNPSNSFKYSVLPEGLNLSHAKKWWATKQQTNYLREIFPNCKLAILPRKRWIGGLDFFQSNFLSQDWDTFQKMLEQNLSSAQEKNECLLVSIVDQEHIEVERGFIVTDRFMFEREKMCSQRF
jgi:hypothetical protein